MDDQTHEEEERVTSILLALAHDECVSLRAEVERLTEELHNWKRYSRRHENTNRRLLAKIGRLKGASNV